MGQRRRRRRRSVGGREVGASKAKKARRRFISGFGPRVNPNAVDLFMQSHLRFFFDPTAPPPQPIIIGSSEASEHRERYLVFLQVVIVYKLDLWTIRPGGRRRGMLPVGQG